MKIINAIGQSIRKMDTKPFEKLESNRVRNTIEYYCEQYLKSVDDILTFEALPNALDATLTALESKQFLEKYEFAQETQTIFVVRLKEFNLF